MKLFYPLSLALLVILFATASCAYAGNKQKFQIANSEVVTINSKILDRKYDLFIKVPRDYFLEKSKSKTYPVLYLNDGPHTFKVASGVTHFSTMDKAIVVGVSFAHGENGQYSRVRDLTPVVDETWTKYKTGGASDYLAFFEKEVIGYVEKNYRTNSKQRILSGHSLGGSFGAWVLLTKPELFSSYILTSPSLWFKNYWIFNLEDSFYLQNKVLEANLYFATGALETIKDGMYYEMAEDQTRFANKLLSRNYQGLTIEQEIVKGTDHHSTFPVGLSKGLMFTYKQMKLI